MDKLVKADVTELNLIFTPGQNPSATFKLSNLMHAIPVAVSLTSTNSLFSFSHSFAVLKPLSTASFTVFFTPNPRVSSPFDSVLVRSVLFPAGRATQDDLRRVFSRPGPHIFRDAKIPVKFFCGCAAGKGDLNQNKTPFDLARERNHSSLYDALRSGEELQRAARTGDVAAVKKCLAEGANVNGRDEIGWTALHRAAFKGRMECVKVLVSHGAEVDAVDFSGYAPLHRAGEVGHRAVALYLIAHGAKANLKGIMKAKTLVSRDFDCCLLVNFKNLQTS
ncbi:PREDICTED: ankyrin repeat domain-containing protein 65-like [Ipomoea nil]|uniref:ankyrin repeat domain-containing protein 65-like n=1 Tax=Ipomoea nil TaxID=35883 RepID=UPI0009019F47|nr:PREDICTED: ankyrin repeat domain-containing protein 65-like [Ipomoea nil]